MGKVRVYELARELGMEDSKPLMRILRDMGYEVKTASSGLSPDAVRKIREVVAPHIEQKIREAEDKRARAEAEKAKKAAQVAKPARAIRIAARATDAQKQAIMDRHRRKLAGEVPMESVQEVMQQTSEEALRKAAILEKIRAENERPAEEAPAPSVQETEATSAVEESGPAVEVVAPAETEEVVQSPAVEEKPAEDTEARPKELPPDQAIAASYREGPPAPPAKKPAPVPASSSSKESKEQKGEGSGGRRGSPGRGGGKTREITQQSRGPRRGPFRPHRAGGRKKKRSRRRTSNVPKVEVKKGIEIPEIISVGDLASRLDVPASDVIKYLLKQGQMVSINQALDYDKASEVVEAYGFNVSEAEDEMPDLDLLEEEEDTKSVKRPPVVTVLGHVDHGKTSLLDAIRETNVTAGEAGGITQRIGAYSVTHNDRDITFIDTPGHEAFTHMRARGAQITDIAVLVVAADDGVMPQTIEAINHARAAKVPIIVAVNKVDKPNANPDRVLQQLTEYQLVAEDWGGDTICVKVSALQKTGINDILEMILLVADMQELRADPDCKAQGIIIEGGLDKGVGPVASVLVKNGTLRVGDTIVVGDTWGRVRGLLNEDGKRIRSAGPSYPAEIMGLADVPDAGNRVQVVDDEKVARQVSEARTHKSRVSRIAHSGRTSLEDFFSQAVGEAVKELNVILKAEAQGSVEAVSQALLKLSTGEVKVQLVHSGVGAVSESDVMLASASDAIIIGFNVRPDAAVKRLADQEGIDIRLYRVIYHVIDDVKQAMAGLLAPDIKEVELGRVEIRQVFKISKTGKVAGCYVLEGKVTRDAEVRLVRDGVVVYEGKLDSLRRFKEDAREVTEGYECGLTIENFSDIQEGDIVEAFRKQAIARETI